MREAFGGISLFQIVIIFFLLFAGIVAFSINHSKAFGVKDELLHILEVSTPNVKSMKTNPISQKTAQEIAAYLQDAGYSTTGNCNRFGDDWVGYDARGNKSSSKTTFCIKGVNVGDNFSQMVTNKCNLDKTDCKRLLGLTEKEERDIVKANKGTYPTMVYYEVALFYQLDIPIINNVMNFGLKGTTKMIYGDE